MPLAGQCFYRLNQLIMSDLGAGQAEQFLFSSNLCRLGRAVRTLCGKLRKVLPIVWTKNDPK